MSRLLTIRHHAPFHKLKSCSTEATVITTSHATEVFARVAPVASGTSRNQCSRQTQAIYDSLCEVLSQHHVGLCNVVTERVFLRDLTRDWNDFQQVRTECYRRCGVTGRSLPAVTCVGQPPCRSGQDVEVQLYAVAPTANGNASVQSLAVADGQATAKVVQIGPSHHLFVSGLQGADFDGGSSGAIRPQSEQMLAHLGQILANRGVSPAHLLRASVYLGEIDRDYDAFRGAHDEFFGQQNLPSWATMGVCGGRLHPPDALCGMDLHALLNLDAGRIEPLRPTTSSEGQSASSSSPGGVKLVMPEHTYLFVSAPIVAADDATPGENPLAVPVERAFAEIRDLLAQHGASFNDLAQVVTRLKSDSLAQAYETLCASVGLTDVPHTVIEGKLHRPELLAELELTAVIASE